MRVYHHTSKLAFSLRMEWDAFLENTLNLFMIWCHLTITKLTSWFCSSILSLNSILLILYIVPNCINLHLSRTYYMLLRVTWRKNLTYASRVYIWLFKLPLTCIWVFWSAFHMEWIFTYQFTIGFHRLVSCFVVCINQISVKIIL